jgi:hypothetical protein
MSSETSERYLGMRAGDLDGKPYAKFWNPRMAPLAEQAREAVAQGPVAVPLLLSLADARHVQDPSFETLENGYGLGDDGTLRVAIRTDMPGTSPAMVDWWFGWHSDEPQRYKLWHPRAHVHAMWESLVAKGTIGRERYVESVSLVDEYLGSQLGHFAIRFIPPRELGLDEAGLADPQKATAVCARVGFARYPLEAGYLLHFVHRVAGGAQMRSHFWLGGPLATARRGGLAAESLVRLARRWKKPTPADGHNLLVHCSQEMSHLASFLPQLYAELCDMG